MSCVLCMRPPPNKKHETETVSLLFKLKKYANKKGIVSTLNHFSVSIFKLILDAQEIQAVDSQLVPLL